MQNHDFFTWRRSMLLRSQEMATAEDVYTESQQQTQHLEFDSYALCARHPVPFTRPRTFLHATHPKAWVAHYQSESYFVIDPVLRPESFSQGHLPWNDTLLRDTQPLWDAVRSHDLHKGMTQCLMLPNRVLGFLPVSRVSIRNSCLASGEVEPKMQLLVRRSLSVLMRLEDDMVMTLETRSSKREKEVLKWTTKGRTSSEMAIILSISENAVNFHQKNMQKKFDASNKTQMACYVVATGLI